MPGRTIVVERPAAAVDTSSMIHFEREQLSQNPQWRLVLQAYQTEQAAAKRRDPKHDGWVPRLESLEPIETAQLPQVHGKLIAHGLLQIRLSGRTAGLTYQLSLAGKQALGIRDADTENENADRPEQARSA